MGLRGSVSYIHTAVPSSVLSVAEAAGGTEMLRAADGGVTLGVTDCLRYVKHLRTKSYLAVMEQKSILGQQDGSVGKDVCHQACQAELSCQDPQDGSRELTPGSCPQTAILCVVAFTYLPQINTCVLKIQFKKEIESIGSSFGTPL